MPETRARDAAPPVAIRPGDAPPEQQLLRRANLPHILEVQELEECPPPPSARLAIIAGVTLIGGFLGWASIFPVTQRAIARGEIAPLDQVQPVQSQVQGQVLAVVARTGERVVAGQPLVRLDPEVAASEAAGLRAREAALALSAARLAAVADGRLAALDAMGDDSIAGIRDSQAAMAEASVRLRTAQLAVIEAELANKESTAQLLATQLPPAISARDLATQEAALFTGMLARGYARRNEVFNLVQTQLRAEGEVARLMTDLNTARQGIAEARARREELTGRLRSEALNELTKVETELAETRQALARAEAKVNYLTIAAPVDGVVKQIALRGTGAVVDAGGLVAEIVPRDGRVTAEVELPTDQIGGVMPGLPARIRVLTYDQSRFGTLAGVVESVSAASFTRQDGSTYFKIKVSVDSAFLGNPALNLEAMPGMAVAAEIITGTQSLLSWLAKPVRNAMDAAFSER